MSKFDTKNLIYEINRLSEENAILKQRLEELESEEKTCGFCTKNCGNDHCITKEEK